MERCGNFQQAFADEKKEIPRDKKPENKLRDTKNLRETKSLRQRRARQFFQADGAQHPVVVFDDALAAEKLFAFGTARDGFARGVIEATLVGQFHLQLQWRFPAANRFGVLNRRS